MRFIVLTLLLMTLIHTTSAEEITTGNLLPNGTGSASNLQSVDNTIPNVQSSCSSFTSVNTTCTNSNWNYQEVEVGSTSSGTGTLNYTGNLVDVTTGSETTTQAMLDNGVTLDSTTVVQNCEWSGSSHQCGQAQSGRDTFKTTVKILDSDGEVLSQVNQIRNTDSGYYGNANKYTDQVIYNGTGSNQFDWTWTGIDGDSTPVDLGGPNLLGAKLTMTYDNTVIANEIVEEISEIFEELQEEIFEEFTFEYIEEMFEEFTLIAPPMEEVMEEEFEEMTFEPMLTLIEEIPSVENETEFKKLEKLITMAKENHSIEGIVHGGILSKYQKDNFSLICQKNDLEIISPLWNKNAESYMKELLEENFEYIISSVSCDGLDDSWLGQKIDENGLKTLENLQNKFGFNLNFEGGEAETFVTNCPLFKKPLFIQDSRTEWDGYRGRFEILEAKLKDNA